MAFVSGKVPVAGFPKPDWKVAPLMTRPPSKSLAEMVMVSFVAVSSMKKKAALEAMGAMSDADNTKTDMRRGFMWLFLSLWCFCSLPDYTRPAGDPDSLPDKPKQPQHRKST